MKKKFLLINLLMSLTVLLSMLFQTIHSYEHFCKEITEKHCDHSYSKNQTEITHSHSTENNCPICHFTFSTYIPNSITLISFHKLSIETKFVFFYSKDKSTYFKGSLFALRAPPTLA